MILASHDLGHPSRPTLSTCLRRQHPCATRVPLPPVQIKIEHRLFSAISMNWKGRPLTSHQVMVDLIANTTTTTGLKVRAQLDQGYYPTGIKVNDKDLGAVPLTRHEFHGESATPSSSQHTDSC